MARALITVPASARAGEVFSVRTLLQHPMESGFRVGADGRVLPRDIVRRFECRYNGELVLQAELFPAIAANPFIEFSVRAEGSGMLEFSWEGDHGFRHREQRPISVT
jgi:sulfur-oxidizing protein SoxZ